MTRPVKEILSTFDTLSAAEKYEAGIEILRRLAGTGDLSEETLVAAGDELFSVMDNEEAQDEHGDATR
jgi:hypothetical protein